MVAGRFVFVWVGDKYDVFGCLIVLIRCGSLCFGCDVSIGLI